MTVQEAIAEAERVLPGVAAPEGQIDPRWQAIIELEWFIETDPEEVWGFIQRWGRHPDEDLRTAIATCLLGDLLESRFDDYFGKIEEAVRADPSLRRYLRTLLEGRSSQGVRQCGALRSPPERLPRSAG
jgi:hypothetical protein